MGSYRKKYWRLVLTVIGMNLLFSKMSLAHAMSVNEVASRLSNSEMMGHMDGIVIGIVVCGIAVISFIEFYFFSMRKKNKQKSL